MKKFGLKNAAPSAFKAVCDLFRCDKGITFKPGELVYVMGIDMITLLLEGMA
ncbi:hypothetical protein NDI47_02390 [Microcoleus vaginatus GB1-A2]|uniref:hypothetical protein n=1 Tax=Microcoleus vaginatus TaxID=119532 RepID=UPI0032AB11FA